MLIRTRGYLPHLVTLDGTYFITFRLHDSIPLSVFLRYREQLESNLKLNASDRWKLMDTYQRQIESYLDSSYGQCWLRDPRIARLLADVLRKHDGEWYILHAYTIMPNHVHVLISLKETKELSETIRHWKGSSSFFCNKILNRTGTFWQREYFDRLMKSERQFEYTVRYIYRNPVKAGLCKEVFGWPWSGSSPEMQILLKRFFL